MRQAAGMEGFFWGLIAVWAGLCFMGCLDEIALEIPKEQRSGIAIRGALVLGDEQPFVTVSITGLASFNSTSFPTPITGASVVLIDEDNHAVDVPMEEDGIYHLPIPDAAALEVKPGKSYRLSVAAPNGKNYISTLESLHPVARPSSLDLFRVDREGFNQVGNRIVEPYLRFLVSTSLISPGGEEKSYLKWNFSGTYKFKESTLDSSFPPPTKTCYVFEELSREKVIVFDGGQSSRDELTGFFLLEEPFNHRFTECFYLTVYQQSLSKAAYHYWEQVGKVVELSGNFFEAPPGQIGGNFRNVDDPEEKVFGYFYATRQEMIRIFVPPSENLSEPFCPVVVAPDDETAPATCLDCTLLPGSTLVKPDFWEE